MERNRIGLQLLRNCQLPFANCWLLKLMPIVVAIVVTVTIPIIAVVIVSSVLLVFLVMTMVVAIMIPVLDPAVITIVVAVLARHHAAEQNGTTEEQRYTQFAHVLLLPDHVAVLGSVD
jgi:hypothetical protein